MIGKALIKRPAPGRDLQKPYGPTALLTPDGTGSVIMQHAQILFENFKGVQRQYNAEGDRNFVVELDPEVAEDMLKDGWNVKFPEPDAEGNQRRPRLQVSLDYAFRPPRVVLISSRGRTDLDESTVGILDDIDRAQVDLIIRPYHWDVNGKKGIKAKVKTLFVTQAEDYLELMYSDLPEADAPELPSEDGQDASAGLDHDGHEVVEGEVVD